MKKYTFKKEERLCSVRSIQALFHSGSSFVVYPFRVVYRFQPDITDTNVLISVSKRRFKHAVQRNRLKRLMREAYRLEKASDWTPFLNEYSIGLHMAFQYVGKDEQTLTVLREKLIKIFETLKDEIRQLDLGKRN